MASATHTITTTTTERCGACGRRGSCTAGCIDVRYTHPAPDSASRNPRVGWQRQRGPLSGPRPMRPSSETRIRADLVLVGGGHAHVQVLRRWMMAPLSGVRLTLVTDHSAAVYSGMVPGFVAGDYAAHEIEIDVVPLARRAGARIVLAAATAIDPRAKRIAIEGRPPISYDVASIDVGSTVRGLDLAGVRAHALATRPIRALVDRVDAAVAAARARTDGRLRIVVVGGGAAGVELACTLDARLRTAGVDRALMLLTDATSVLPDAPRSVAARAAGVLRQRSIALRTEAPVHAVETGAIVLATGRVEADLVIWATGAAPPALLAASPLPRDERGFVRVASTLEVIDQKGLFAAGDCATLVDAPWVPKSGVYAVREGPVLDANLRATLVGGPLRSYRPQRSFLRLLNLGGREALGTKLRATVGGRWVWRWKDRIDRRFVRRFQVLTPHGLPAPDFPSPEGMDDPTMRCGGCAAKLAAPALVRTLGRLTPGPADDTVLAGLDAPDDAAAVRLRDGAVQLATIDAFRAFTDDPWLVGKVAAINALSDVYAKGGSPRHALALVTVPEGERDGGEECLHQTLGGIRAALDPLGVTLVGGHTTAGPELFVGLAISGDLAGPDAMARVAGAEPGDLLILTKPLGTGLVLAADPLGLAAGRWVEETIATMLRPNRDAAGVLHAHGVHACTDVSGFGLAGHLHNLLRASRVSATIALDRLPLLAGARVLLGTTVRSTYHAQNALPHVALQLDSSAAASPLRDILLDPQTSGGLLAAVPPTRAEAAVAALHAAGDVTAAIIGRIDSTSASGTIRATAS